MRAAVISGPGTSPQAIERFQSQPGITWSNGLPAVSSDADAILIFGGDGTIHRHLAQLVKLQLPVLVVPCGSGNDFARALNLRSIHDAVRAWKNFQSGRGSVRVIDLGIIRDLTNDPGNACDVSRYFCCVACVGLDAAVAGRANRLPRWLRAHGGYALSLPSVLCSFKSFAAKFTNSEVGVSSDVTRTQLMLAAFANTPAYGHGAKIAPRAELDDGKLDVCTVRAMGKMHLLSVFPSVYLGRHLSLPQVKYFQTENLRMETEIPMDVYADGEYVCQTPIEISVARNSLRVIVPRLNCRVSDREASA